jgi:hypothetical protein
VLVQQHPDHEGEPVAAEQLVGRVVPGDVEAGHMEMVPPAIPAQSTPAVATRPHPRRETRARPHSSS